MNAPLLARCGEVYYGLQHEYRSCRSSSCLAIVPAAGCYPVRPGRFRAKIASRKECPCKRRRFLARVAVAATLAWCLFASRPPIQAQGGRSEHWVGTWATAVVARPQGPPGPALGFGVGVTPQCFGQAPTQTTAPSAVAGSAQAAPGPGGGGRGQGGGRGGVPPAPINFNNQTLRQIVHTSLGGDRVQGGVEQRVRHVPAGRRCRARRGARQGRRDCRQVRSRAGLRRQSIGEHSARRDCDQRSGESHVARRPSISRSTCICLVIPRHPRRR